MKRNWVSISCTHIENSRAWNWKLDRNREENREENKAKPLVNADYFCPLQAFLPPSWAFFFSF
jgi:hypothetical protein